MNTVFKEVRELKLNRLKATLLTASIEAIDCETVAEVCELEEQLEKAVLQVKALKEVIEAIADDEQIEKWR